MTIAGDVEVQVDSQPGTLIDLSTSGAQVVTISAMKPNRLVKLVLPADGGAITCKAKVAWARLEPRDGQFWYRAGMAFTTSDQAALEAFLKSHEAPRK